MRISDVTYPLSKKVAFLYFKSKNSHHFSVVAHIQRDRKSLVKSTRERSSKFKAEQTLPQSDIREVSGEGVSAALLMKHTSLKIISLVEVKEIRS